MMQSSSKCAINAAEESKATRDFDTSDSSTESDASTKELSAQKSTLNATNKAPLQMPECLLKTNFCNPRWRKSCYFDATLRWGVKNFQPYNHMLLPTSYTSPEQEYWNLRNNVCLWDVAVER